MTSFARRLRNAIPLALAVLTLARCGGSEPCNLVRPAKLADDPRFANDTKFVRDVYKRPDAISIDDRDFAGHADLRNVLLRFGYLQRSGTAWTYTAAGQKASADAQDHGRWFDLGTAAPGPFTEAKLVHVCAEGDFEDRVLDFQLRYTRLTPLGSALLAAGLLDRFQREDQPGTRWHGTSEPIHKIVSYPDSRQGGADNAFGAPDGDQLAFPWQSPHIDYLASKTPSP